MEGVSCFGIYVVIVGEVGVDCVVFYELWEEEVDCDCCL